jgi:hypothetical protein
MKNCRKWFFSAFLAIGLFGAQVIASEALINSEASVDVTGKDAVEARDEAIEKAQFDALRSLINKLAPPGQTQDILNQLDAVKIAGMVRGTEILEEKITENRYRARMIISFDADAVSTLITKVSAASGEEEEAHATTNSFLVIPSYEEDKTVSLWEEKNLWKHVWKSFAIENLSGDIVVPVGDNSDIAVIDVATLSSATYSSLSPLAIRYGASDIVILSATYTRKPDTMLTVVKRRMGRTRNEVNALTYRADPQETRDMLLARAARDIAENLHDKKTEEVSTTKGAVGGERNKIMILASITTLNSWTELKTKLATLPMIDRIEMLAISPQQVDMAVYYRGTPDSLAGGIDSLGLRLGKYNDYWVITRD